MTGPPMSFSPIAARRHGLVDEVRRRLIGSCQCGADSPIVIGLSGGPDSLAMLIACAVLRSSDQDRELLAVHVHHHLRKEADADATHVEAVCRDLDVQCRIEHVHVAEHAGNTAAQARRLRYETLQRVAAEVGSHHVAVAHHAEDQLETMIMALCRGAGLAGLSAMPWRRGLSGDVALIRPLLAARKAQCTGLCETAGISWCEDASNSDLTKARARIRAEVMPVLESLWPQSAERASATADLLHTANEVVNDHLENVFGRASVQEWPRADLRNVPIPLLAAGLRRAAIHAHGSDTDALGQRKLIPAAEAVADAQQQPRTFHLLGNVSIRITAQSVQIVCD